jgi:UDP-N-acetylmuramoyl-tripeptide--D-alanyl-D-alanine ligase
VAVLGDMLELGPDEAMRHAELGDQAAEHASLVAFFGPRNQLAHQTARARLGDAAAHFEDPYALVAWLGPQLKEGDVVLVKGSRGMRLERVVDLLVGHPTGGAH